MHRDTSIPIAQSGHNSNPCHGDTIPGNYDTQTLLGGEESVDNASLGSTIKISG
jgi:hypothetical protein